MNMSGSAAGAKAQMIRQALGSYDSTLRDLLGPGGDEILDALSSDSDDDEI